LHDGDPAVGEGAAVPLLEGERFQPHHQPQQPHLELFRRFRLCRFDHLVVDRGKRGGFGDPTGHTINDPNLFSVQIAAPEGFPHSRETSSQPP
jgi:hypothetical protein